jgi:hypothetical protein
MTDYVKANDALVCNKPRQLCPLKLRLRSGGSRKSIAHDSVRCSLDDQNSAEFNSTAASRTKRWKNTGRYRVILIEPTAGADVVAGPDGPNRFLRALAAVSGRQSLLGVPRAHAVRSRWRLFPRTFLSGCSDAGERLRAASWALW